MILHYEKKWITDRLRTKWAYIFAFLEKIVDNLVSKLPKLTFNELF